MKYLSSNLCPGMPRLSQPNGVNTAGRYILLNIIPVLGLSFLCLINIVQAAPDKNGCAQSDVYEQLECRQEGIAVQMDYLADEVFGNGKLGEYASPANLDRMKNAKRKANFAKERNTAKAFKKLAKAGVLGNREAGHLVPLGIEDDDLYGFSNDGICDYEQGDNTANCAAIKLDDFGQLQPCNPEKVNKGSGNDGNNPKFAGLECDRWYESEAGSTTDEVDEMKELAQQLDEGYSATEDDLLEINAQLDIVNANLPEVAGVLLYAENGENSCVLPELTEGLSIAVGVLRGIHAGLAGGAAISSAFSDQTVVAFGFGGNASLAQMPLEVAALAANVAYIVLDEINQAESSALQEAIMGCVNQASGNIDVMVTAIDDLQQQLEDTTAELTRLLHTPEGMRSSERPVCNELPCSWPFIPGNWPDPPESE